MEKGLLAPPPPDISFFPHPCFHGSLPGPLSVALPPPTPVRQDGDDALYVGLHHYPCPRPAVSPSPHVFASDILAPDPESLTARIDVTVQAGAQACIVPAHRRSVDWPSPPFANYEQVWHGAWEGLQALNIPLSHAS